MVEGNGAVMSVAFVAGNTGTRIQWGAGSIPAQFTVCSVTRYSGTARGRILNAFINPSGNLNWLHGHHGNNAGVNYYDGWFHVNSPLSFPVKTDWVAMCGSNLNVASSPGIVANGIIDSAAKGGTGNCALGINHAEQSDWQLSKVYIWDKHLSDSDFQLASNSLYSGLFSNTRATGVCLPCQANSQSQAGASSCGCDPGYTANEGWRCTICPVNTFKALPGNDIPCTACGENSDTNSQSGRSVCTCHTGYTSIDGGPCVQICVAGATTSVAIKNLVRAMQGNTSVEGCECQAGSYQALRVLNPPEAFRKYSSVHLDNRYSQLDSLHPSFGWVANTNDQGEWMEIDAGELIQIVGVIIQGQENDVQQMVTEFRVESRIGVLQEENVEMPGTFSAESARPKPPLVAGCFQHRNAVFYSLPNAENVIVSNPYTSSPSSFTSIRWASFKIDLTTLRVDIADYTFATQFSGTIRLPFGYVKDCAGRHSTRGRVVLDLRGTPFAIEDFGKNLDCHVTGNGGSTRQCGQWTVNGWYPAIKMTCVNGQFCTIGCGGSCGQCFLTSGYLQLKVINTAMLTQHCPLHVNTDARREHLFVSPIYARYIRMIPLQWVNKINMRAALIVKSCTSCFSNAVSMQGSTSPASCECRAGTYITTIESNVRAISLVPGRAQLSTLANRNQRLYPATAVFDRNAGPNANTGAVSFDRALSQYIDGGSHTLNIASNTGFTAVVLLQSNGSIENREVIFDFSNSSRQTNYITLTRYESTSRLLLDFYTGGNNCSVLTEDGFLLQSIWQTIVITYSSNSSEVKIKVGSLTASTICTTPRADMVVSSTHIGTNFMGNIAGLYAVDDLLTEAQISQITSKMHNGGDILLSECTTCPVNSSPLIGSTIMTSCQCNAGYQGPDGGECLPCAAGTFKLGLGSTCSDCPDGTYGTQPDNACIKCPHGKYNLVPGAASSDMCLSCGPGKFYHDSHENALEQ